MAGRDLTGSLERGAYSLEDSYPLPLCKRLISKSGHVQVGNETDGVQTTKVAFNC